MELILITVAFFAGFIAIKCQLPPLVGFLVAGFALSQFGYQSTDTIITLADLGVTLLLFTIGLKLDIRTLLSKEIWASATVHNLLSTSLFTLILLGLKNLGISNLAGMDWGQTLLLGFALSFSSTVFAVKTLQEKGELNATYGNLAIGILVMQDVFAVIFLTASTGKLPHWYAIVLFALPLLRPLMGKILDKAGHGEMLVLSGIFFALVTGAGLFEIVGMKSDLGALILGMLLASHGKASELSKSLFNLKELFLVCFFLNIGLAVQTTVDGIILGILLLILLPLKGVLYFLTINAFKFRVRTSLLASLTLFNFSEFGLIVGGLAYQLGWLSGDLLVAIAVAVSLSFVISAPFNRMGHDLYRQSSKWLKEQAEEKVNLKDQFINPGEAQVLILGMGRIGTGAYDEIHQRYGKVSLGVEVREEMALTHQQQGRNVITGDATDPDFWERILNTAQVKLVLLAMPNHLGNQTALSLLNQTSFNGQVAAIAAYPDQLEELNELGVDACFNIYSEAGSGFARNVCDRLQPQLSETESP